MMIFLKYRSVVRHSVEIKAVITYSVRHRGGFGGCNVALIRKSLPASVVVAEHMSKTGISREFLRLQTITRDRQMNETPALAIDGQPPCAINNAGIAVTLMDWGSTSPAQPDGSVPRGAAWLPARMCAIRIRPHSFSFFWGPFYWSLRQPHRQ